MKYSRLAQITIIAIMCNLGIDSLSAMKKEAAPASEQELVAADNLRGYRNLIMIMEYGAEILDNSNEAILELIAAFQQPYAFILIPAPLWDYFMRAKIDIEKSSEKIDAQAFFDQTKWNMHKICLNQAEKGKAHFYILIPQEYAKQLKEHSTIPTLKEKLSRFYDTSLDEEALNKLNDLGISLFATSKVDNPYTECGELGKALDTYHKPEQKDELKKQILAIFSEEVFTHNKLLACLNNLMSIKKTHEYLLKLKKQFEKAPDNLEILDSALSLLPRYNVYLTGHGTSPAANPTTEAQLNSLLERARKFGFWPGSEQSSPLSTSQEIRDFRKDQAEISENLIDFIAGLTPRVFGSTLEFFNGVTNFFTISTCHGAGIHLALPFVFMNSPQKLSYTLVTQALLHAPTTARSAFRTGPITIPPIGSITGSITQGTSRYYYIITLAFKKFFNGVSNFSAFIENEAKLIQKTSTPKKNYFARLLNYVANFLDNEGGIRDINNVPWVKLPGNTPWQVVSFIDNQALFITDVMIRAQQLEKAPIIEGQKPLGQILQKKMSGLPEEAHPPQQQALEIPIPANKNLIFVATHVVPLRVFFEEDKNSYLPPKPKSIIPLGQSFAPGLHVTEFTSIATDYDFNTFYKSVLKPVTEDGQPLFKMPENTLFFIKELICKKGSFLQSADQKDYEHADEYFTINNCMVLFDVPGFEDYDICFMIGTTCCGIKRGTSKKIDALNCDQDVEEIDLNKKLIEAFKRKNKGLVDILIKAGANAAVIKAQEEPATKKKPAQPRIVRAKSMPQ
ncbi:MAG: hypothetical protein WC365_05970 [Candidatus Babeliales bacterium]|jgi:hypothetical protein